MRRFSDQLSRGRHERIPADDHEEASLSIPLGNTEQIGHQGSLTNTGDVENAGDNRNQRTVDHESSSDETASLQAASDANSSSHSDTNLDANSDADTNNSPDASDDSNAATTNENQVFSPELAQLLAERDIHRRKSSICAAVLVCVLLRMWIMAIMNVDISLIIFNIFMTSYFLAWRIHLHTVERDQSARILEVTRRDEVGEEVSEDGGQEGNRQRRATRRGRRNGSNEWDFNLGRNGDHVDLDMLGFQAQLALAIMESQRHVLDTGGYGRPGGEDENQMTGVNEKIKAKWEAFAYNVKSARVEECSDLKPHKNEDPSCCICLCEYEEGEMLNQLRCGHVYHQECIDSWCQNHTRCPLCNLELDDAKETSTVLEAVV